MTFTDLDYADDVVNWKNIWNTWILECRLPWWGGLISSPHLLKWKQLTGRCNAAPPRPAILPSCLAFTLLGYNCLCIKTELQYVSHGFITYSCALDGKLIEGCCCLLRAFSNCSVAISLHLVPTFKMAIVLVSALHDGCGSEQNSKLPKNVQWKSTRRNNALSSYWSFLRERLIFLLSLCPCKNPECWLQFLKIMSLSFYSLLKFHKCLSVLPWASEHHDSPLKKHG